MGLLIVAVGLLYEWHTSVNHTMKETSSFWTQKDTEVVNIRVSVLVLARGHGDTSQQVFGLVGQRMVEL